jgi:hypothetical protein
MELDKTQVEVNYIYRDEHHDDDQQDNPQLKYQSYKKGEFDQKVF